MGGRESDILGRWEVALGELTAGREDGLIAGGVIARDDDSEHSAGFWKVTLSEVANGFCDLTSFIQRAGEIVARFCPIWNKADSFFE
jgi:hypothetical protein